MAAVTSIKKEKIPHEVKQEDDFDEWLRDSTANVGVDNNNNGDVKVKIEDDDDDVDKYSVGSREETDEEDEGLAASEETDSDATVEDDVQLVTFKDNAKENLATKRFKQEMLQLCKDAPLTEFVGSQCKYTCLRCERNFRSWASLKHHISTNRSHGPTSSIKDHLKGPLCHKCRECGDKILSDRDFLTAHMKRRHGLSLTDYCNRHQAEMGGRYKAKRDVMKTLLAGKPESANIIGHLCSFKCSKCSHVYNSYGSLTSHLKKNGHGPKKMEDVGLYLTKAVGHRCKICSELLMCDPYFILSHAKTHGIKSIQSYCEKTKTLLSDNSIISNQKLRKLMASSPLSTIIENSCEYVCDVCGCRDVNWEKMIQHLKTTGHNDKLHMLPVSKYLAKAVFYECLVCRTKVLCDLTIIHNHLSHYHKLSVSEYKFKTERKDETRNILQLLREIPFVPYQKNKRKIPVKKLTQKVGNLCRFSCPICPKFFTFSWMTFQYHGKKHHQKTFSFSIEDRLLLIEARYHECFLCADRVLGDPYFLKRHLRNRHKDHTSESYHDLVQETNKGELMVMRLSHGTPGMVKGLIKVYEEIIEKEKEFRKTTNDYISKLKKSSPISISVENLCEFECDVCGFKDRNWGKMIEHLKIRKHTKEKERIQVFRYFAKSVFHKCLICSDLVICDLIFIKYHARHFHNLSVMQYKYQKGRNLGADEILQLVKEIPMCSLPNEKSTIPMHKLTLKVGNLCTFSCPFCPGSTCYSWRYLKTHCKRIHGQNVDLNDPGVLLEARYHKCLVCSEVILGDPFFLGRHLFRTHKGHDMNSYHQLVESVGKGELMILRLPQRMHGLTGEGVKDQRRKRNNEARKNKKTKKEECPKTKGPVDIHKDTASGCSPCPISFRGANCLQKELCDAASVVRATGEPFKSCKLGDPCSIALRGGMAHLQRELCATVRTFQLF